MTGPFDPRAAVRRHAAAAGLDLPDSTLEEIVTHLEDLHADALADGASEDDAAARALAALAVADLAALGRHASRHAGVERVRRADLEARAGAAPFGLRNALRGALHQFRRHPGLALTTVLVLGLGLAAATTVFTVVDSVVLRPLPYTAPDRLVTLWDTNHERGLAHDPISPVNFMDDRALPVFSDAAAWWWPSINLADAGLDPVRVRTVEISGNAFEVLGVSAALGEGFPAGGPLFVPNELIAVISDRLWRERYSADPAIVGRLLTLSGSAYRVVGVMPPKFHFPDNVDVWQRLRWDMTQHSREAHFMHAVARLADGTTLAQAQAAVDTLAARLQADYPQTNKAWGSRLVPLLDEQLGYYRPALMVLFGAVALLLTIACLNVASLLLTRTLSRERELAVRAAMGATPRQLATQLLAEGAVLSLAGAIVGVAAAAAALPLLVQLTPVAIPRLDEATVDWRAMGLGLLVVSATTIVFGFVPSLAMLRTRLVPALRSGERGSSRGARRIYSTLVVGEVALACALLVCSGLLVQSVRRLMQTQTGVDADEVVVSSVELSGREYSDWRRVADTHGRLLDEIRRQPGVSAAGAANFLPLEVGWRGPFGLEGEPDPPRPEDAPQAQYHSVSDGYFETLRAQMTAGRTFTAHDASQGAPVVVVNEEFARRHAGGAPMVGRGVLTFTRGIGPLGLNLMRVRAPAAAGGTPHTMAPPTRFEVVGIVRDIRNVPLGQAVEPAIYFPARQFPFRAQFIAVRATDRATAIAAIRSSLGAVAPGVPLDPARSWGERHAARSAEPRLLMVVLLCFAVLAGALAALGVYGLFSWSVTLRTRELAIRLTLGARPVAVAATILRQSFGLVCGGLIAGFALVAVARGVVARVLYDVSPADTGALAAASALLLGAALVASLPPAVRAMRVDPVEGLRVE